MATEIEYISVSPLAAKMPPAFNLGVDLNVHIFFLNVFVCLFIHKSCGSVKSSHAGRTFATSQ